MTAVQAADHLRRRRTVETAMPAVRDRLRAAWRGFLAARPAHHGAARRVLIVIPLSVVEDIESVPAVGQILSVGWIDPLFAFALPTEAAARLFRVRARDLGFDQRVVVGTEIAVQAAASALPGGIPVCRLPVGAVLDVDFLDRLGAVLAGTETVYAEPSGLVIAADAASAWTRSAGDRRNDGVVFQLGPLLRTEPPDAVDLSIDTIMEAFRSTAAACAPPRAGGLPRRRALAAGGEGGLRLSLGAGGPIDLMVVRTGGGSGAGERILQRRLLPAGDRQAIRIDPPLDAVSETGCAVDLLLRTDSEVKRVPLHLRVPPSRIEPFMVTCYLNRGGGGNAMMRAFAEGIGCALRYAEDEAEDRPGVPIVWGVLRGSDAIVARARAAGRYFFYVDHAYFGRGHGRNYRVARNAYEAGPVRRCPADRIAAHGIALQPWQRGGETILVCPPTDYFMAAHGCADWLETTLADLARHTDRPVVVRRKPQPGETVEPLEAALRKAHALVTHSSNVAVEAVIAGTPVFVSPTSAAAPMGRTDLAGIESPVFPDRDAWLAYLAYCQYSLEEMRSGKAWRLLLEMEERELIP